MASPTVGEHEGWLVIDMESCPSLPVSRVSVRLGGRERNKVRAVENEREIESRKGEQKVKVKVGV